MTPIPLTDPFRAGNLRPDADPLRPAAGVRPGAEATPDRGTGAEPGGSDALADFLAELAKAAAAEIKSPPPVPPPAAPAEATGMLAPAAGSQPAVKGRDRPATETLWPGGSQAILATAGPGPTAGSGTPSFIAAAEKAGWPDPHGAITTAAPGKGAPPEAGTTAAATAPANTATSTAVPSPPTQPTTPASGTHAAQAGPFDAVAASPATTRPAPDEATAGPTPHDVREGGGPRAPRGPGWSAAAAPERAPASAFYAAVPVRTDAAAVTEGLAPAARAPAQAATRTGAADHPRVGAPQATPATAAPAQGTPAPAAPTQPAPASATATPAPPADAGGVATGPIPIDFDPAAASARGTGSGRGEATARDATRSTATAAPGRPGRGQAPDFAETMQLARPTDTSTSDPGPLHGDSAGGAVELAPGADPAGPQRSPDRPLPGSGTPPLPPGFGHRLAEAVVQFPDRPVELTLSPEELGRVRMTLSTQDGALSLAIQADRPDTIDLMRRHIDQLAQDFRDLGFTDVSFSFAGGDGAAGDHAADAADETATAETAPPDPTRPASAPGRTARAPAEGGLDLRL